MKIILLCSDNHNQIALANKIANRFNLTGVVIEKHQKKKISFSLAQLRERILDRTIFYSIHRAWYNLMQYYKSIYPDLPETQKIEVGKINSTDTIEFISKLNPDLLMVSGTSIIGKQILNLPIAKGIVNLHTGLSPYIKGAPNCTNWCIAKNSFHLIGNTVMWIDAGIDSGNIITTEQIIVQGQETLEELHLKVMEHAHELYCKAVEKIETDFENCPNIKQASIDNGTTYYSKDWNWKNKLDLISNFKRKESYVSSKKYKTDLQLPTIINL